MDTVLKGLFGGGDDDRSSQARDFVSRFEQGPIDQGYSDDEAFQNYQRVAQHVDPATYQRAAEQTLARMDPNQRAQFAQMLQQRMGGQMTGGADDPRQLAGMVSQMHQQDPGGLASLFGGGGSGDKDGGGLGDMLGSVLGGGGFPGGTLGKVALGGIAAYAMKEMLGGGDGDKSKKHKRSV
jgi:hypothetical protein